VIHMVMVVVVVVCVCVYSMCSVCGVYSMCSVCGVIECVVSVWYVCGVCVCVCVCLGQRKRQSTSKRLHSAISHKAIIIFL
jgi:hypothetical protein